MFLKTDGTTVCGCNTDRDSPTVKRDIPTARHVICANAVAAIHWQRLLPIAVALRTGIDHGRPTNGLRSFSLLCQHMRKLGIRMVRFRGTTQDAGRVVRGLDSK